MRNPLTLISILISLGAGLLASPSALAQMFTDPLSVAGPRTQVAGVFSSSDIEYEDAGGTADIERKILGVEMAKGLSSAIDGFAQFGLIMDSSVDNFKDDGKGYTFGLGGRGLVHREATFRVSAYGAFTYQSEEFKGDNYEVDLTTYDLHGGGVIGFAATPKVMPYGGLDLVLLSDGEFKVKSKGRGTSKDDIERDNMVNFKLGSLFTLTSAIFRAELTIIGEKTFTLAAGTLL